MASGYTVSGLTSYVEVNKDVLIKNIVLGFVGGDTIPMLRKQLNVKTKERLNYLDVDPVLQDGSSCGFSPSGKTEFSERDIEVSQIKAQDQYCDKDLLGKFAEYLVKTAATKDGSDMPFEAEILDEVSRNIAKKMEKLVWQGSKTGGDLFDGFLTQALGADSAATITVTGSSATSISERIEAVIMGIPEDAAWLDSAMIFVSPANFRKLAFELIKSYKYNANMFGSEIEDKDIVYPGTNIKVHKTYGLTGSDKVFLSPVQNLVYGTDLMNDEERIRFWYDDNSELFKYSIHWVAGVKTLYPDAVVVGDFSA